MNRRKRSPDPLLPGVLWAELDVTPQTGRKDAAPDRFRRLFLEIEEYLKRNDIIYVPVGPTEYTGGSPVDIEYVIPLAYSIKLAEKSDLLSTADESARIARAAGVRPDEQPHPHRDAHRPEDAGHLTVVPLRRTGTGE